MVATSHLINSYASSNLFDMEAPRIMGDGVGLKAGIMEDNGEVEFSVIHPKSVVRGFG